MTQADMRTELYYITAERCGFVKHTSKNKIIVTSTFCQIK